MTQRSTPGCVLVAQSCPTLYDPMDCSPPGSSVHGISLEMEWVAFPFSRGSSWHRDWTWASLQADSLPSEPSGKPLLLGVYMKKKGNTNLKRYMHQIFIISLFIIAKTWKQPMCICVCVCVYVYLHKGILLLSHMEDWNFAIFTNMNELEKYYTKWSQTAKDR